MKFNFWYLLQLKLLKTVCKNIFELRSTVQQNPVLKIMWRRFEHRVSAGMKSKIRPWGRRRMVYNCSSLSGIHIFRAHPPSRVSAAIPGGTVIGPVLDVRILKILGEHGLEISIPSILSHEETSYVLITRRSERSVDEIHNHIKGDQTQWWIAHSLSEIRRELSTHASMMVTKMVRHHDQEEREQDGSYHWDTARSVLLKAFAKCGAGELSDNKWIHQIHEGSCQRGVEYCVGHENSLSSSSNPGTLWWCSNKSRNNGIHIYSLWLERIYLSQEIFMECSIDFEEWTDSGSKKGKRQRPDKQSFSHPLKSFGSNPDEENPRDDHNISQKAHHKTYWKHKMQYIG